MNTVEAVTLELEEMKRLGLHVPARAIPYCCARIDEIEEYRDLGMKISEIADLVINLVSLSK